MKCINTQEQRKNIGCHNIRDGDGDWERLEKYISERSDANFIHGICPNCLPKAYLGAGIELK